MDVPEMPRRSFLKQAALAAPVSPELQTVRISPNVANTAGEIDLLFGALEGVAG
ncbi:MAG: hypothetical protein GY719_33880 [bacterium]|nr:hypothetical protein [bacterium]